MEQSGGDIANFGPVWAGRMPRYEQLEFAVPPARAMLRHARQLQPQAVHISTPGPVGLVGLLAARRLGGPALGVYHTDFPAYIDHLFGDSGLTRVTSWAMWAFYRRFAVIFTRSDDYAGAVRRLGVSRPRIVRLLPGIDVSKFQPSMRDESVWDRLGVPRAALKVLYVGRVSGGKNLPLLSAAWRMLTRGSRIADRESPAHLVVLGDGPYRARMEGELAGLGTHFPGFVHARELSAVYAGSDLFVFPSATDTLGQVVMEAQSAGLPVLVSDQGGPREVVVRGRTGLVLPAAGHGAAAAWEIGRAHV